MKFKIDSFIFLSIKLPFIYLFINIFIHNLATEYSIFSEEIFFFMLILSSIFIVTIIIEFKLDYDIKKKIKKDLALKSLYNILFAVIFFMVISILGLINEASSYIWFMMWFANITWILSWLLWIIIYFSYLTYKLGEINRVNFIPPPFLSIALIMWSYYMNIMVIIAILGM